MVYICIYIVFYNVLYGYVTGCLYTCCVLNKINKISSMLLSVLTIIMNFTGIHLVPAACAMSGCAKCICQMYAMHTLTTSHLLLHVILHPFVSQLFRCELLMSFEGSEQVGMPCVAW